MGSVHYIFRAYITTLPESHAFHVQVNLCNNQIAIFPIEVTKAWGEVDPVEGVLKGGGHSLLVRVSRNPCVDMAREADEEKDQGTEMKDDIEV